MIPWKWFGARIADIGLQEQDVITTLNFQFTINVLVNVMTTGTLGCRKTISFAVMEKGKPMYCRYAKFYTDNPKDLWCYRFGIPYNVYQKECINCKSSPEYIEKVFEKEENVWDEN